MMVWTDFIARNTFGIAMVIIIGFSIWWFWIRPKVNEGLKDNPEVKIPNPVAEMEDITQPLDF